MQEKIKNWNKMKTTLSSGLQVGHFKSYIACHKHSHKIDDKEDKLSFYGYQETLLICRLQLVNYVRWSGNLFVRWQKVITCMIIKELEHYKLHRLCVIHLYKANYSMLYGMHWKNTLHKAEDYNLLNDGAYGSSSNVLVITPVFLKEIMIEI